MAPRRRGSAPSPCSQCGARPARLRDDGAEGRPSLSVGGSTGTRLVHIPSHVPGVPGGGPILAQQAQAGPFWPSRPRPSRQALHGEAATSQARREAATAQARRETAAAQAPRLPGWAHPVVIPFQSRCSPPLSPSPLPRALSSASPYLYHRRLVAHCSARRESVADPFVPSQLSSSRRPKRVVHFPPS